MNSAAIRWAPNLTAPEEIRAAAIAHLADNEARDERALDTLASINDPLGVRLVSEARARKNAVTGSEIIGGTMDTRVLNRDELKSIGMDLLPSDVPFAYLQGDCNERRRAGQIKSRVRLAIIAAAFGIAAVLAGAIAAKAHAIHTATIAQGAMQ